ncbi:MAG TPA: alpha/beta hydrolase-fold protein [Chitinophagales bacterium]|nr:alpha/beta hydrolase-fold protein [Chitinophagales bacterium]
MLDSKNKTALRFVNIGIRNKNIGCSSLDNGTFTLRIPIQNENDTITFSLVGYSDLHLLIADILSVKQKTFLLEIKPAELAPVTVVSQQLVEKKVGIVKYNPAIHFTDGSTNQNDIFEIAQLIRLDSGLSKITSVSLYINEPRNDSGTFRINFYDYRDNRPADWLLEKNIMQTHPIVPGWMKFDLTEYNLYLEGNFVVAIEFIPSVKKTEPIYYEVKLGGPSKSFVRTSSQGEWAVPPHHYRLFVTALVPVNKNAKLQDDPEEKETVPALTLFSDFVKDSFSVFIRLPKDYMMKKERQTFPVIYSLDANAYFDILSSTMEELKLNKAILVGIGYKNFLQMDSLRNRDYTFPSALAEDSFSISGGGNKFLAFIQQELIPLIDSTYRSDPSNRTIMGHSLGGYFTLYALEESIKENKMLFKNYVAASPSLGYHNQYLLNQFENQNNHNDATGCNVFLTFGGREDAEDAGKRTTGIDDFNSLVKVLSEKRFDNIQLKSEVYPAFGHMETAIPTFTSALKKID